MKLDIPVERLRELFGQPVPEEIVQRGLETSAHISYLMETEEGIINPLKELSPEQDLARCYGYLSMDAILLCELGLRILSDMRDYLNDHSDKDVARDMFRLMEALFDIAYKPDFNLKPYFNEKENQKQRQDERNWLLLQICYLDGRLGHLLSLLVSNESLVQKIPSMQYVENVICELVDHKHQLNSHEIELPCPVIVPSNRAWTMAVHTPTVGYFLCGYDKLEETKPADWFLLSVFSADTLTRILRMLNRQLTEINSSAIGQEPDVRLFHLLGKIETVSTDWSLWNERNVMVMRINPANDETFQKCRRFLNMVNARVVPLLKALEKLPDEIKEQIPFLADIPDRIADFQHYRKM